MVQLQIISGKQAGLLWEARRFPVRVGRRADMDLRIEDDGVWDDHFQLSLDQQSGFHIAAQPGVLLAVNQTAVQSVRLRNSDIITVGAAQISFRLSPTRQKSLRLREWFVWALLLAVTAGQMALIFAVLR
jgi:hypothetical protein